MRTGLHLPAAELDRSASIERQPGRVGRQFLALLNDPEVMCMIRLMIAEATAFPRIAHSFHDSGPLATLRLVARIFAAHLPADEDVDALARRAASEFLSLVKGEYFMERLLGTRTSISPDDLNRHVDHCVRQICRLYPLEDGAAGT